MTDWDRYSSLALTYYMAVSNMILEQPMALKATIVHQMQTIPLSQFIIASNSFSHL